MNYLPNFFEFIETHLNDFGLCLIARPPLTFKNSSGTKIDSLDKDELTEVYDSIY